MRQEGNAVSGRVRRAAFVRHFQQPQLDEILDRRLYAVALDPPLFQPLVREDQISVLTAAGARVQDDDFVNESAGVYAE